MYYVTGHLSIFIRLARTLTACEDHVTLTIAVSSNKPSCTFALILIAFSLTRGPVLTGIVTLIIVYM